MTGAAVMTVRSESPYATDVFRAAVDSARLRLPALPLVVVDDCSPDPAMLALLSHWDAAPGIHLLRMGPPLALGCYQPPLDVQNAPTSYGHAPTLDRGLWYAYHTLRATWALTLDGDVFCLAEDMAARVQAAADRLDANTVIAGEWVGTPETYTHEHWCDAWGHYDATHYHDKAVEAVASAIRAYGYINKQCSVVYLPAFWDERAEPLQNTGWVSNTWFYSQMALGRRALYVPFFRDQAAVHLGAVAVAPGRGWGETGNVMGRRYGQRMSGNYYAGYLEIPDLPSFQRTLAGRVPGAPIPRAWFREPGPVIPEYPSHYLRYTFPLSRPLYDDQVLSFDWVDRAADKVLAQAVVHLEGDVTRIETIDGQSDALRACYEEIFEHSAALRRSQIWTPVALAARIGSQRAIEHRVDDYAVFFWKHISRSGPRWRWAEHYGWGQVGMGPVARAA